MNPKLASIASLSLLLASAAPASARMSLTANAGLGFAHDDNILQYSSSQLATFAAGTRPNQFSIQSSGDALGLPQAGLVWAVTHGRRRSTEISLRGSGEYHSRNGTADYSQWSAGWRESFATRRFSLLYLDLPNYYLRQLIDDEAPVVVGGTQYRRAQFGLTIASFHFRQRVTPGGTVDLGYQHEHRAYNADFPERTSNLEQGSLGFDWTRPRTVSLSADLALQNSKAKASDADDAGVAVPDDADVSYHGWSTVLGARVHLVDQPATRLDADFGLEFGGRHYDSNRPLDRYHQGRNDSRNAFEVGLRGALRPHWSARLSLRHDHNSARLGAAAPPTSDSGSYDENRIGLSFDWEGEIWHRARRNTAPEQP